MADDQYPSPAMVEADGIERAAQAEDDVAPALARRRTVVELTEQAAELRLIRKFLLDAAPGQAVEHAEFLLAQPFIDEEVTHIHMQPAAGLDDLRGSPGAQVRRGQHHLRPLILGHFREPVA